MSMNDAELLVKGYDLNCALYGVLTAEEIKHAANVVISRHPELVLTFIEVNFKEYTQDEIVGSANSGKPLIRNAEVITQSKAKNQTLVDIVQLPVSTADDDTKGIDDDQSNTTVLQDVQAGLSPDEYQFVETLCKTYQPLLDAIAKRGLDPAGLVADAWCLGSEYEPTERVCWPSLFYCEKGIDHLPYGRPIEGFEVRISLTHRKVIRFEDNAMGVFPIPSSFESPNSHYLPHDKLRTDFKPLVVTQPEGPSFVVTGEYFLL